MIFLVNSLFASDSCIFQYLLLASKSKVPGIAKQNAIDLLLKTPDGEDMKSPSSMRFVINEATLEDISVLKKKLPTLAEASQHLLMRTINKVLERHNQPPEYALETGFQTPLLKKFKIAMVDSAAIANTADLMKEYGPFLTPEDIALIVSQYPNASYASSVLEHLNSPAVIPQKLREQFLTAIRAKFNDPVRGLDSFEKITDIKQKWINIQDFVRNSDIVLSGKIGNAQEVAMLRKLLLICDGFKRDPEYKSKYEEFSAKIIKAIEIAESRNKFDRKSAEENILTQMKFSDQTELSDTLPLYFLGKIATKDDIATLEKISKKYPSSKTAEMVNRILDGISGHKSDQLSSKIANLLSEARVSESQFLKTFIAAEPYLTEQEFKEFANNLPWERRLTLNRYTFKTIPFTDKQVKDTLTNIRTHFGHKPTQTTINLDLEPYYIRFLAKYGEVKDIELLNQNLKNYDVVNSILADDARAAIAEIRNGRRR
jgi:hypothetical protein